jgi:hypothetical protein
MARAGGLIIKMALLVAACAGEIEERAPGGTPAAAGPRGPAGGPMAPADRGGGATPAAPPAPAPGTIQIPATCGEMTPGPASIRRLSNREYDRAVRDLLHEPASRSRSFPTDPRVLGFDNMAEALHVSESHAERYLEAAEDITASIVASPERRTKIVGCDLATTGDRAACLGRFIDAFVGQAFRRRLEQDERARFVDLATRSTTAADPWRGARLVIQAALQSPSFLLRTEAGAPEPGRPRWNRLTGEEIATRLSFLIWGSTPGAALLDQAAAGQLDTAGGVERAARAMLADERAREPLRAFAAQWARLDALDEAYPDPKKYKIFTESLRASMRGETERLLAHLMSAESVSFLDLFSARYSFLDAGLARLYGLAAPPAPWSRVDLEPHTNRGGLLTHASILTATAADEGAAPIIRGKYVREVLLCQTLPEAPGDVPPLPDPRPGQSERERLERHRGDPACAGCHRLLDPVGFGLEQYDAIGAYRATDSAGRPLGGQGALTDFDVPDFTGPFELSRRLRDDPRAAACIVRHAFRYGFGRVETQADACTITQIAASFAASQHSFRDMVVALARSDAFRYVTTGGAR